MPSRSQPRKRAKKKARPSAPGARSKRKGTGTARRKGALKGDAKAKRAIAAIGRLVEKPGLRESAVFGSGVQASAKIPAYSVHPKDPTLYIRRYADGRRDIGRLKDGKFISLGRLR
jgi:hypothetical protein